MAEQYQREYDDPYRGGRRGRGEPGDSGRWQNDDARMQPHDVHEDGRYTGGSRSGGRDTRQEYESRGRGGETPGRSSEWGGRGDQSSRGNEWSATGRGGYGSESGEYEPSRWRDQYSPQGSGRYDTQSSQSWRSQGDGWNDPSRGGSGGEWGRGTRGYGRGDESGNMGAGGGQYGGGHQGGGQSGYGQGGYGQSAGQGGYGPSYGQGYRQGSGGYGAESWRGFDDQSRGGGFARNWDDLQSRQGSWPSGQQGGSWQGGGQSDWQQRSGSMGSMGSGSRSSFAGRGPKDYQRSDERIREEVSDRMTDDHELDASEITVEVRGGEVTLSGTVRSRDQKRRAEDLAESCSGVGEVTNNIRVKQDPQDDRHGRSGQSSSSQSGASSPSASGSSGTGGGTSSGSSGQGQTVTPTPKAGRTSSPSSGT